MQTILDTVDKQLIKAVSCPKCGLCGSSGEPLYQDQPDRLFQAPGLWSFRQCSSPDCRLVWLDPMPLPDEIWKAYLSYYTHGSTSEGAAPGLLKRSYLRIKRGYWAANYGYTLPPEKACGALIANLLRVFPLRRADVEAQIRFLGAVPRGRLLDLGCGSGEWLLLMRELGWEVEGLDFDESAVRAANALGLNVQCGALEAQNYPASIFDAVTLNHVIEHVPDPVATLSECRRILKPGGHLMIFTPNNSSLGHRIFKKDWRGLEPPRHLHIFCPRSMTKLLNQAGFNDISVVTTNSPYVWDFSFKLWAGHLAHPPGPVARLAKKVATFVLTFFEQLALVGDRTSGECLTVRATNH